MDTDLLQGFYLRDWHIDPVRGDVYRQGDSRHLPPKAVEVLLCLARAPGELVTRDVLLECAWGKGEGSQEALSHAVSEIRQALGDSHENPTFIQTLPRRGYRLVVEPRPAEDHTESVVIGAGSSAALGDIGLFENLNRRGVLETGLAYLVLGWLIIQVADIVFSQLHLPAWAGTFVTMLVIVGFPIALVLSWFLEFRDGRAVLDDRGPRDERRRRFGRTYLSVVGGLAIAAFGVYVYDQLVGLPSEAIDAAPVPLAEQIKPPPIVENSVAVLPFLNLDGSGETQTFANGLVDDVISQLSRVPGLRVASRGDSFTLSPNSASQEVRNRLRVERYLEGSVEMAADKMRVTVQLIDSKDGFHILSRNFDRPREDFFKIRDEITNLTVANVRVALPEKLQASSVKVAPDPSLNAWVLYRRGIADSRKPTSIDTVASALGWFDAALNVDPEFAAAHAGKCAVYVEGYDEVDDASYIDSAESSCATALALNPNLDIVHIALGNLYRSTGRYDDAEREYKLTLGIDPTSAEAFTGLGDIFMRQKRFEEAEASLRRAVEIHPGNVRTYNMLGVFYFRTGRYKEAAEQYQYVVALDPEHMIGITNLASANMLMGRFDIAASAYQQAIDVQPTMTAHSNLGLMHYYLGNKDAAIESHSQAVAMQPKDYLARSNLGDALWIAGREDEALDEFKTAETLAGMALDVNPNDPLLMMDLAWIRTALGKRESARALIDKAIELAPTDPYVHYIHGLMLNRFEDTAGALQAFRTAIERGYSRTLLASDPNLTDLRGDARFNQIVNRPE